jgi:TonB family protein
MRPWFAIPCLLGLACAGGDTAGGRAGSPAFEPPILTNPETPVRYPPGLFAQRTEGTVVLRLFVDERGQVVGDSTRLAERSGHDALDSAALAAVPVMRFAPARRDGAPVATAFLQPVHFRHPETAGTGGS